MSGAALAQAALKQLLPSGGAASVWLECLGLAGFAGQKNQSADVVSGRAQAAPRSACWVGAFGRLSTLPIRAKRWFEKPLKNGYRLNE